MQSSWFSKPVFFGVIHLPALPGAPDGTLSLAVIVERAVADARALVEGGADGILVENFGDAPFYKDVVPSHVVAAMTVVVAAVRKQAPGVLLGVNILRNDALSALAVAAATEADFIRVNVHCGVVASDQGLIEGQAMQTLLLRRQLGVKVAIFADVHVKHARSLHTTDVAQAARDTAGRGKADVVILTGQATGGEASVHELRLLKTADVACPLLIGSGVTPDNVSLFVPGADGVIVGTFLHREGLLREPIECSRVLLLRQALDECL
jgi:membrane complex biogenesis BtpA family protein